MFLKQALPEGLPVLLGQRGVDVVPEEGEGRASEGAEVVALGLEVGHVLRAGVDHVEPGGDAVVEGHAALLAGLDERPANGRQKGFELAQSFFCSLGPCQPRMSLSP